MYKTTHFPTTLAAITTLIDARNAGDIDTVVSCYEATATVVARPDLVLSGVEGARAAAEGFLALRPVFTVGRRQIVEGETTSLHLMQWRLQGTGPDGQPLDLSGCTTDVFRKQPDGGWLLSIDNPWGIGPLSAES
jgi:ketosteroid isomerase-like protein